MREHSPSPTHSPPPIKHAVPQSTALGVRSSSVLSPPDGQCKKLKTDVSRLSLLGEWLPNKCATADPQKLTGSQFGRAHGWTVADIKRGWPTPGTPPWTPEKKETPPGRDTLHGNVSQPSLHPPPPPLLTLTKAADPQKSICGHDTHEGAGRALHVEDISTLPYVARTSVEPAPQPTRTAAAPGRPSLRTEAQRELAWARERTIQSQQLASAIQEEAVGDAKAQLYSQVSLELKEARRLNEAQQKYVAALHRELDGARRASEERNRTAAVLETELRGEIERSERRALRKEHKHKQELEKERDAFRNEQVERLYAWERVKEKQSQVIELCEHNQVLCEQLSSTDASRLHLQCFQDAARTYLTLEHYERIADIAARAELGLHSDPGAAAQPATNASVDDAIGPDPGEEQKATDSDLRGATREHPSSSERATQEEGKEDGGAEAAAAAAHLAELAIQQPPSPGSPSSPAYSACTTPSTPLQGFHISPEGRVLVGRESLEAFREAHVNAGGLAALFASDEELFSCSSSEEDPEIKVQPKPLLSQ